MAVTTLSNQSNTVSTGYVNSIDSLYSFNLTPQKWKAVIDLYGPGLGIFQWLYFAGQTVNVKSHTLKTIERGSLERGVQLDSSGISTSSAGADVTFKIAAGEYNASNECYLNVDDVIIIPPTYASDSGTNGTTPLKYQIVTRSGSAGDYTFTARPFSDTASIGTQVPGSTTLMVTGGNFARGSDGPGYKSRGWYERAFYTAIKRAAFQVEGGATATERFTDTLKNGDPGFFTRASLEADFLLDSAINDEVFLGEIVDNSNLVMANRGSSNVSVYGTEGLWHHLDEGGMRQTYVDDYTIANFDELKDLFTSQGITSMKAFFGVGSTLNRYIENSGLDFLKEYSGGTDLMNAYGEMGVEFKAIRKNGMLFMIQPLVNFDNPVKYGLSAYKWKEAGFIVPQEKVTVRLNGQDGDEVILDNVALGYLVNNGEDRERVVKILPGVEGITGNKVAVDTYDDVRGELLTEFMLVVNKRNQMIQVTPSDFAS